ncbi:cellulase family glycosylhydrolase [Microvirga zambiensis]|uniref:cellulase family glycosylhydrolase n=1 Tax=Microvirga zambiensis TaxID=1402137 RepID=UPI001AEF5725|nr:cellulase family glycosylhydrolase [Microvirga zambiensis]
MTGYLSTQGNQIVDSSGTGVLLAGVNWFGMESNRYAPDGLQVRNYKEMMHQMADLGFNTIRLPFSDQLFDAGSTPNGIDFGKNPDLAGLTGLQIMDKIVAYAGQIGLKIILDHHRSSAGAGANANGLWYEGAYTEQKWIANWTMLAGHYADNPTVIGADLHNEPHGPATWGGNAATDWAAAAERAGNAVLAANPNWLIFVEGIEVYNNQYYWWGGNLMGVKDRPIVLDVPGRLVYSAHDYPNSIYAQPWFNDPAFPNNLPSKFDQMWGYIYKQNIAPVYLGEFGSKLTDPKDLAWLDKITAYLSGDFDANGTSDIAANKQGVHWTWWSWNPNSGDTGGILQDDWTSVHQNKITELQPIMWPGHFPLVFLGSGNADQLYAGERASILSGLQGDDFLHGGASDDTLQGGSGNDVLNGGDGTDTAVFTGRRADYTIRARNGGEFQVTDHRPNGDGIDVVTDIEQLQFADGVIQLTQASVILANPIADQISLEDQIWSYQVPANTFVAGPGVSYAAALSNGAPLPNWIAFNPFKQSFSAQPPRDYWGSLGLTVIAAAGGKTAADSFILTFAAVNDAPDHLSLSSAVVVENSTLGTAIGSLSASDVDDASLHYSLLNDAGGRFAISGGELVVANRTKLDYEQATSYQVVIRASDDAGLSVDKPFSISIEDVIGERVIGTAEADLIKGNLGNDRLFGGGGNDSLYGGSGNDILRGDSGRDTFVFDTRLDNSKNFDRILDFNAKDDSFWLDNKVFTKLGAGSSAKPGKLKADMFFKGKSAQDKDDRIIYDTKLGILYYDPDGIGAKAPVKFATLAKNLKMTYHDFFVI